MRTDKDTWDITTSVGSTALFVAAARALEAQKPEPLSVDPYAEVFCRAVGGGWADVLDGVDSDVMRKRLPTRGYGPTSASTSCPSRARVPSTSTPTSPTAADAGVRQIVILAAGLDSRAYRLPWPDGTVVYELDQPQVLAFKREALDDHGDAPRAERREVAVDLRDDWSAALEASGFDPSRPSAWIAEGLLIYLPAIAQEQLFEGIDALSSPGSWVAVEEGRPMPQAAFEAKQAEERAAGAEGTFFTLVYNEQHAARRRVVRRPRVDG